MSRGRVMAQQVNTQSFSWDEAYPQEVPSTA